MQYMQGRPDNAGSPSAAIKHATDIIRKQLEGAVSGSGSEEEALGLGLEDAAYIHNLQMGLYRKRCILNSEMQLQFEGNSVGLYQA